MKVTTSLLAVLFIFSIVAEAEAQLLKKLGNAAKRSAERTTERRVEKETSKKTDEALDEIFGDNKNKKQSENNKNGQANGNNTLGSSGDPNEGGYTINTAKDFERGNKITFQEQFSGDAIGDFPVTWNTNASAEVVTFGNNSTRWLKMTRGVFMPDGVTRIPKNSTIEMDISHDVPGDRNPTGAGEIYIKIAALNNKAIEMKEWDADKSGKNGVILRLDPTYRDDGRSYLWNKIDGATIVQTPHQNIDKWSGKKNTVHLSLWRQENRLRVYLDDEKILDLPRAFGDADYNSLIVSTKTNKNLYVGNILIAEAGADTRHRLLETGSFTTSDILFETGKATIQPSSFTIIDEIAEVLNSNPSKHLTITGHTDSDGSESANQTLSEQRAESVKNYLVYKHNISGDQITTQGKGESQPVASGNSAEAKAQNRRVEFLLK